MPLLRSLIHRPCIGRNILNGATFESSVLGHFQIRQADNLVPLFACEKAQGPRNQGRREGQLPPGHHGLEAILFVVLRCYK